MSTNKTAHFGLHAWESGDVFLRSEFNENFAALDGAIAAETAARAAAITALDGEKAVVITGMYTGDGQANRTITLGTTPKLIMTFYQGLYQQNSYVQYNGVALRDRPLNYDSSNPILQVVEGGFLVNEKDMGSGRAIWTNHLGLVFLYLAVV